MPRDAVSRTANVERTDVLRKMAVESNSVFIALTESDLRKEIKDAEVHINGKKIVR